MQQPRLDVFQVIADPSRRQMLHMLSEKSQTINSLAGHFDMSRPAVSKHVKIMHMAGFISIEDIGRERHCTLKQDGFKRATAMDGVLRYLLEAQFKALEYVNGREQEQKLILMVD